MRPAAVGRMPVFRNGSARFPSATAFPPPARRSPRLAAVVGAVVIVVAALVVVAVLATKSRPDTGAAASATGTPTAAAPTGPLDSTALSGLLLSPEQVAGMVGAAALVQESFADSVIDDSEKLLQKDCIGVMAPAQHLVYGDAGWTGVRSQALRNAGEGPRIYAVIQAVISFPNADAAKKLLADQQSQWASCSGRTLSLTFPTPAVAATVGRRHTGRHGRHDGHDTDPERRRRHAMPARTGRPQQRRCRCLGLPLRHLRAGSRDRARDRREDPGLTSAQIVGDHLDECVPLPLPVDRVPMIICANTTPRSVAQITSATPSLAGSSVISRPSWLIAAFISSRCRRDEPSSRAVGPQDLEGRHRRRAAVAAPGDVDDDLDALSHRQVADLGRRQALQQPGHAVVDDGHQQAVAVAEVVLDHSPGDARAFGDMLRGRGGETLLDNAADGFVDDLRASVIAALAWRTRPPGGAAVSWPSGLRQ